MWQAAEDQNAEHSPGSLPGYWERLLGRTLANPNHLALTKTNLPVLVLGETGTGKSTLARALHQAICPCKPYVEINVAALGTTLFLSEMFGHEKGAFTGAQSAKKGLATMAEGGMLFLDEVGELSPECQAHLLSFLDSGRFRPVGGVQVIESKARIVTATNRDLEKLVQAGTFREDLYYRLASVVIRIPALRERREDIGELARSLATAAAQRYATQPAHFEPEAIAAMERCAWPGNVRQLRFFIERLTVGWAGQAINADTVLGFLPSQTLIPTKAPTSQVRSLSELERESVRRALEETGGNRTRAAELLGISARGLYNKIKKYELDL